MATNRRLDTDIPNAGMYVGYVKDPVDKNFAGRLKVWIPEFNSREDDETGWVLCNYCSPFGGATNWKDNRADSWLFEDTQTAYGFWAIPPDINNEVVVMFPNNDPARAIWIGCLFKEFMNFEVPGIPSSEHTEQYKGKAVPGAEYNKALRNEPFTQPFDPRKRAYHKTRYEGISSQGLINDKVRGLNTSGAQRESPSQVFGILTPGAEIPNTSGDRVLRTGGSSFVMDDAEGSEYIAFTTKSGAQIKIDETNEMVYIINKPGSAWVQLDKEGNVDIFSAKSISMRAQEDINMRADRNINIEAGQNIFMKAAKDTDSELNIVGQGSGIGGDIFLQSENNMHTTVKESVFFTVTDGNLSIDVNKGTKDEHIGGDARFTTDGHLDVTSKGNSRYTSGNNYDVKAAGNINFDGNNIGSKANGTTNIQSTGATNLLGATVNINSGGSAPGAATANEAGPAQSLTKEPKSKTNVLADYADDGKFVRNTNEIETTVRRFLTFEPCPAHNNKGGQ